MQIRPFEPTDEVAVVTLWRECDLLRERGCPKVGLLVRNSNREAAQFYRRLGYLQDESISLGKRLIADA